MAAISVRIEGRGTYSAPACVVDLMVDRHLPASPAKLRAMVEEQTSEDWSDVTDVSALLVVLADFEAAAAINLRSVDERLSSLPTFDRLISDTFG